MSTPRSSPSRRAVPTWIASSVRKLGGSTSLARAHSLTVNRDQAYPCEDAASALSRRATKRERGACDFDLSETARRELRPLFEFMAECRRLCLASDELDDRRRIEVGDDAYAEFH